MKKIVALAVALAFAGALLVSTPANAAGTGVLGAAGDGASISGHVTAQPGDPIYLGSVSFEYYDDAGNSLGSFQVHVDENNNYSATGLPPATYRLHYDAAYPGSTYLPTQYYGQSASNPGGQTFAVAKDQVLTGIDFTLFHPADVNGLVLCNSCQSADSLTGTLQALDTSSASWKPVGSAQPMSPPVFVGMNDPRYFGYNFSGLLPGTYRVAVSYSGPNDFIDFITMPTRALDGVYGSQQFASIARPATEADGVPPAMASFVTALYFDFLDRRPAPAEVAGWSAQLLAGAPKTSVVDGFANSDEYRLDRIDDAYETILSRPAEPQGRQNWLEALRSGRITLDDVQESFYASVEWFGKAGGTNRSWVSSLYTRILLRVPADSEVSYWENLTVKNGQLWVVGQFWEAFETAKARVAPMYMLYLGRPADSGGLTGWTPFEISHGDSATRAAFTASAEYYSRTQTVYP